MSVLQWGECGRKPFVQWLTPGIHCSGTVLSPVPSAPSHTALWTCSLSAAGLAPAPPRSHPGSESEQKNQKPDAVRKRFFLFVFKTKSCCGKTDMCCSLCPCRWPPPPASGTFLLRCNPSVPRPSPDSSVPQSSCRSRVPTPPGRSLPWEINKILHGCFTFKGQ